ncbi:hypothetical protein [Mucilaginibacter sp.]|jgi:hypothetical protein|uniref:hypothetical protein n=1 Tax=Mucilaginibacter sp. TaxID=1882438 RepID=UPI003561E40C
MTKKRKKQPKTIARRLTERPKTYRERLEERMRYKNVPKTFLYNYHTLAFHYFHAIVSHLIRPSNKYRKEFWQQIPDGIYSFDEASQYLQDFKSFIEGKMKTIVEKYSIYYWLHVTRRVAPNTLGDDHRPETIMVCRNIIVAAIQKYGLMKKCDHISLSTDIEVDDVFNGLFMQPKFETEKQRFLELPSQLVLTKFDEQNLLEYYELEILAYELWLTGSKSRITAKGANLVVDHKNDKILLDDRSRELESLIENYDSRSNSMTASATGTVFKIPESSGKGLILLTQIIADRTKEGYSDPITELLGLEFIDGGIPNFGFNVFDIKTYLSAHLEFANDFHTRWGAKLEYVIALITDIGSTLNVEIINDKDLVTAANLMFKSYRIYHLAEYMNGIKENWAVTTQYLNMAIPYDNTEIEKAFNFLTLSEVNRREIFLDNFGPLRVFIPAQDVKDIFVDHSIIGNVLYNLFYSLPLKERNFKGELLENALKYQKSYLPTTESKGLDGTSKQVDFSVAKGDILILIECKAVARSFGIFGGQTKALQHRLKNVIHKGLNDVDEKVKWFLTHQEGTNYNISHFKYILGVTVSPFTEFMPSWDDQYWLNDKLPRVLTIGEFEKFIDTDLKITVTKNLILIKSTP